MSQTILDGLVGGGVAFEKTPFPAGLRTVEQVAGALGISASQIVKAMLIEAEGRLPLVVGLPGDRRLDLKALGTVLGVRSARLVERSEVSAITGVPPGAVTPLLGSVRDDLEVVLDSALSNEAIVNASSGDLSLGVSLAPSDLHAASRAIFVNLDGAD